jgi:hypothetical protein
VDSDLHRWTIITKALQAVERQQFIEEEGMYSFSDDDDSESEDEDSTPPSKKRSYDESEDTTVDADEEKWMDELELDIFTENPSSKKRKYEDKQPETDHSEKHDENNFLQNVNCEIANFD